MRVGITKDYFNPHFRKGSDRDNSIVYDPFADFNPHFRKGSDQNR